ncbi:MAG: hypothetical protein WB507_10025 [Solirubrobacterales bacterium]
MIQVNFSTFELDPDTKEWIELPVAQLLADHDEVQIGGPHADWINLNVSIIDPESGKQVARDEDAERWARLLPFAYRSGDISVEVAEIDAAELVGAAFHYSAGH